MYVCKLIYIFSTRAWLVLDRFMLSIASSGITMKRKLCCKGLSVRPRCSRKIFTLRRLTCFSIAVYVLIIVFSLHTFREKFAVVIERFESLPSQGSLLRARSPSIVSTLSLNTTNTTLSVVKTTAQTFVSRTTVKQENYNSSDKALMDSCRGWCRGKTENSSKPYFLTAVLLVRIYVKDLAQLTTREMRQWLYYLRYAGFEHVYVYDAFVYKEESQEQALKHLIDEGFVTYVDWSHRAFPYSISGTQHAAYQDCIVKFGHESIWQAAIDIDEYPFSPTDQQPKFAQRKVASFSKAMPIASELTMQNFLFLGKPLDSNEHPLLIDRLWRRTHGPANALVKPIYKPSHVARATVHHNALSKGSSVNFPVNELRMNHYWGARLQNWGEDTPEILGKTQPDTSMETIVKNLKDCITHCLPSVDLVYRKEWS